ncbi:1-phosphofructokinase family hexose kinase [Paracoccus jiaweipingae]|uniref:1-phosphofructokinase family hexose kinase n=1 Tax=unclassified Paracoccus (in: a-proteobacteria) TaxID=2688777 RepID=UPI00378AF4F7
MEPQSALQTPILTVTLNPALDLSTGAAQVVPDIKLRCDPVVTDPGGGGINVSRAIAVMGGHSQAMVALGGATGQRIAEMLPQPGIDVIALPSPGETRQSLAVMDHNSGLQYRFVMPGPEWDAAQVQQALDGIRAAACRDGWVVLSGSNPPGVPADFARRLSQRLRHCGANLLVDTSGPALHQVAKADDAALAVLRMDEAEATELAARPLPDRKASADFASDLVASGVAQAVIVARGSDGNIVATPQGRWHAEAAKVDIISKVGAGDSFVAGFVLARARGMDPARAMGLGAAAASATCMTPATELCHAEDVAKLDAARVITAI